MCSTRSTLFLSSLCIGLTITILVGCGSGGSSSPTSRVTIVLSNSEGPISRAPIDFLNIEYLQVTVTRIDFQRCDGAPVEDGIWHVDVNDDSFDPNMITIRPGGTVQWVWTQDGDNSVTEGPLPEGEVPVFDEERSQKGEFVELLFDPVDYPDSSSIHYFSTFDETMTGTIAVDDDAVDDDGGTGGHIVVFSESMEPVEFKIIEDYMWVDQTSFLNSLILPSGRYCKIRLWIKDPVLILMEDPQFASEDIHLTANGRLFIGAHFELVPGAESIITINFNDLHLVESGSSGHVVLTPQLRADVVGSTPFHEVVDFVSVDCDAETLIVKVGPEPKTEFTVIIDAATIVEVDSTPLSCMDLELADLPDNHPLDIEGMLSLGYMIDAETITVDLP